MFNYEDSIPTITQSDHYYYIRLAYFNCLVVQNDSKVSFLLVCTILALPCAGGLSGRRNKLLYLSFD